MTRAHWILRVVEWLGRGPDTEDAILLGLAVVGLLVVAALGLTGNL